MKLSLAIVSAVVGLTSAKPGGKIKTKIGRRTKDVTPKTSVTTSSKFGKKVLSRARRLEQDENENQNNNNQNQDNGEIDFTWVANMSLKFQGCYHSQQWNEEADGNEDIRISTQKLVRFRLCPSSDCSMESAYGCKEGYGDYIIDMETYLEAYFESVEQDQEYNCEYERQYGDCAYCENANDDEICEYDCYMGLGMEYCTDGNPYQQDGQEEEEEEWELREMAECAQYDFGNRRKLEENGNNNNNNQNNNGEEIEYFIGAYCAEQGGGIYLGLFTDETCSQFADEYAGRETFSSLSYGKSLPYSDTTMVGTECMSCKEPQDADQNNDNDQQDADEVKEGCEQLYEMAGKCEEGLNGYVNSYGFSVNNNACNFMQGIKIIRKNGKVVSGPGSANTMASIFIGLFACSFVLMGGYAYYLKTKLDRSKVNLSE